MKAGLRHFENRTDTTYRTENKRIKPCLMTSCSPSERKLNGTLPEQVAVCDLDARAIEPEHDLLEVDQHGYVNVGG